MPKILLVEDDFSLRDIYSARFQAENFNVITASDGEEALATAVREHPDLIVLDVMMPKISGFDVLDILRSTPETKEIKVIMMTALSQETDRQRGESLGVNKYLVKSQVTLEDVVAAVKEALGSSPATGSGQKSASGSTSASTSPGPPSSPSSSASAASSPTAPPSSPTDTSAPRSTKASPAEPPPSEPPAPASGA